MPPPRPEPPREPGISKGELVWKGEEEGEEGGGRRGEEEEEKEEEEEEEPMIRTTKVVDLFN